MDSGYPAVSSSEQLFHLHDSVLELLPSNTSHRGWFSVETIFQVLKSMTKMANQEKIEVIQPPTAVDKQLESYSYSNWAGKIQEQYQKIKENAETYPYVWGSYIVVYGGFGLWFAYRWRRLRKTEDRVRVLQERLRKLVQAEELTSSSATKTPSSCDKSTK
ncbi:putative anaphase-promoting complex subunit 7-like [Capsicum annuum]|nr:putative anaphase-promoting complex subunit 7-like [Capsicum annuum]